MTWLVFFLYAHQQTVCIIIPLRQMMPGAYSFFGFPYVGTNVRPVWMRVHTYVILLDLRLGICTRYRGWSGGAKVSCILCHRGVQLILAYSWARPAILVAGKGREVMFLFLLFLHFHSCSSFFPVPLFHLFCYLFRLFSPFLWETTQNDPQGLTCR